MAMPKSQKLNDKSAPEINKKPEETKNFSTYLSGLDF